MSRFLLAAMLIFCLTMTPALAAGQAANNTTTTAPPTTEEPETVAVEIDNTTTLSEWSFTNGTWRLVFDADVPARIVITDSARAMEAWENAEGKTSADLNPERYTLQKGETVVTYPGTTYDGQAAITVATSDGMRFLATGGISRSRPPVAWDTAQMLIIGAAVGAAALSAIFVRRRYTAEDMEVDRIA